MGNVAISLGKCATNQQINAITNISKDINPYYLYYNLSLKKELFKKLAGSTNKPLLPKSIFKEIDIPIHDYPTQNLIANFMLKIDNKIKVNNSINEKLQEMAKTLYDYWFTQFDFPDKNGKPYKSSGGKMVYNEQLKREIPEGWEVSPILNILKWKSNSQPPKSEFIYKPKDGYIRFIQNRDYGSNSYLTYIPYKDSLTTCTKKDILIDKYGDAGRVRYGIDGVFNVALAKLDLNNPLYLEYVRFYFEDSSIYNYLHNSCMASTRASLNEDNVKNLNIIIPSNEIINMFNQIVEPIRNKLLLNMDEIKELTSLREFLLPMLMNGQATVCDNIVTMPIKESVIANENIVKNESFYNQRFDVWLSSCGVAARGDIDKATLREIFDAMDEDDK